MSAKSRMLNALVKNRGKVAFTVPQAQIRYGVDRVVARIHELREDGHKIVSVPRRTSWGTRTVGYGLGLREVAAKR